VISTLGHEMAHHWQHIFGKPSRNGYHNRQWAAKMEEIGLMPSDTGEPGGKKTGQRMSDYIIPGGPFEALCAQLIDRRLTIPWGEIAFDPPKVVRSFYTCPACKLTLPGKRGIDGLGHYHDGTWTMMVEGTQ